MEEVIKNTKLLLILTIIFNAHIPWITKLETFLEMSYNLGYNTSNKSALVKILSWALGRALNLRISNKFVFVDFTDIKIMNQDQLCFLRFSICWEHYLIVVIKSKIGLKCNLACFNSIRDIVQEFKSDKIWFSLFLVASHWINLIFTTSLLW